MAVRRKRRVSPRFFLIVVVFIGVVAGLVFAGKKLLDGDAPDVTPTPVPTSAPQPSATPKPSLPPGIDVVRSEAANPSSFGFSTEIFVSREEISSYSRDPLLSIGRDSEYTAVPGILTFGGNNYRNTFTYGQATITDKRLKRKWEEPTGTLSGWTGTSWTGQPLIVEWPAAVRAVLGVDEVYKTKEGFTEVIYPATDGFIYFLDLDTGTKTRNPISAGVVCKGTACLDPNGYPLLYVGQAIPVENDKGNGEAYIRVFNLITNELVYRFGGYDYSSHRNWQAYDGSPIISNDTILYTGENGVLYTSKLNTVFDAASGTVTITPDKLVKFVYDGSGYSASDATGAKWYGMESSVAAFRNYAFFTDNGGRLQCIDVNTMKLKYVTDLSDETDSTPVLEESYDDNTVYLYTGSQVRNESGNVGAGAGYAYHRRINAMTGAIVWEQQWICSTGDASTSGGTLATPHVGRGNLSSLVIYSLSQTALINAETGAYETATAQDGTTTYQFGGRIIAYNKQTGEIVWQVQQTDDYWASPVVVYDENMKGYLLQCDRGGFLKMYDALTGSEIYKLDLGSRIDSTPAVFRNTLVVGTRGKGGSGETQKIIAVTIS